MDCPGVGETAAVFLKDVFGETVAGRRADLALQVEVDKEIRVGSQQFFRQAVRLDVKEPVPVFCRKFLIGVPVHVVGRQDVQQGAGGDFFRVVLDQAVADAGAAVVPCQVKA